MQRIQPSNERTGNWLSLKIAHSRAGVALTRLLLAHLMQPCTAKWSRTYGWAFALQPLTSDDVVVLRALAQNDHQLGLLPLPAQRGMGVRCCDIMCSVLADTNRSVCFGRSGCCDQAAAACQLEGRSSLAAQEARRCVQNY